MRLEILVEHNHRHNPLTYPPQKDGSETLYSCGLLLIGSWASRIEQHQAFCKNPMGKYILKLENLQNDSFSQ